MRQNKEFDLLLKVIEKEMEDNKGIIKSNNSDIKCMKAKLNNTILLRIKNIILEESY